MAGPVHYEIYIRRTPPDDWSLSQAMEDRRRAMETAEDLMRDRQAVAVRVTTLASNSPATLRSAANGVLSSITVNGKRELVSILPVASDGTIALTTDSGATHVTVDVLGYFVTPGGTDPGEGRLLAHANQVVYDTRVLNEPLQPGEKLEKVAPRFGITLADLKRPPA